MLFAFLELPLLGFNIMNWQLGSPLERFITEYKVDDTSQRLYPIITAFNLICILLAITPVALSTRSKRTLSKFTLAIGATTTIDMVLNICSLALRQIIIAEPLDVPAVIAKWPNDTTREEVYRSYEDWISMTGISAAAITGVSSIRLMVFLVRGALAYLHWAARHQPRGTAASNDENNIVTGEPIQLNQGGQSDSTGPLASLFETHEELRARATPHWMVNEE